MKIILVFISMFLFNSNYAFAKDMYFICPNLDWKYSKGFFGKGKMYYDKSGEWREEKNTKITDDRISVGGWHYLSETCKPKCDVKKVFDLVPQVRGTSKIKYVEQKIYAVNNCSKEGSYSKTCSSYKVGELLNTVSCDVRTR